MSYHAKTVLAIGAIIGDLRFDLGLSMRTCDAIGAAVYAATGCPLGLSYKTLAKKEAVLKKCADNHVGNITLSLALLLSTLPTVTVAPFVLISADGYKPGNAFRARTGRQRVAVALSNGLDASRYLTVCDKRKPAYYRWWVFNGLQQLVAIQEKTYVTPLRSVPLRLFKLGGDHCELHSLFSGVGGKGHRSAFCATPIDSRIEFMHRCKRLSIQEMDAHFPCNVAAKFVQPCYTVTPALHDTKGIIAIIAQALPGGAAATVEVLGREGGNMTGSLARDILYLIRRRARGNMHVVCIAMEVLIFFRYQDIPVRFSRGGVTRRSFFGLC